MPRSRVGLFESTTQRGWYIPSKAEYGYETDSEQVPRGKVEKNSEERVKKDVKPFKRKPTEPSLSGGRQSIAFIAVDSCGGGGRRPTILLRRRQRCFREEDQPRAMHLSVAGATSSCRAVARVGLVAVLFSRSAKYAVVCWSCASAAVPQAVGGRHKAHFLATVIADAVFVLSAFRRLPDDDFAVASGQACIATVVYYIAGKRVCGVDHFDRSFNFGLHRSGWRFAWSGRGAAAVVQRWHPPGRSVAFS